MKQLLLFIDYINYKVEYASTLCILFVIFVKNASLASNIKNLYSIEKSFPLIFLIINYD